MNNTTSSDRLFISSGLTFYRGTGSDALALHEATNPGPLPSDFATSTIYGPDGHSQGFVELDAYSFRDWVNWVDPRTGERRGMARLETRPGGDGVTSMRPASPRFAEMVLSCDRKISVVAALDARVGAQLREAQLDAADAIGAFLAQSSVAHVGSRDEGAVIPVDRFEQVAIARDSSIDGLPYRRLRLQWSTRVLAGDEWRSLDTVALLKQQAKLREIGEAVVQGHQNLRRALEDSVLKELLDEAAQVRTLGSLVSVLVGDTQAWVSAATPAATPAAAA